MSLFKHSAWNLLGSILPLVLAIPVLGYLARKLGVEYFGIFTLFFAIVGYASLFDVGLSRAVIREVAISGKDSRAVREIIGTASVVVLTVSIFAAISLVSLSVPIVSFISVSKVSFENAVSAVQLLAISLPFLLLSSIWFAYLEGKSEFVKLNLLRSATGALTFCFPALIVSLESSLISAVLGLLVARVVTAGVLYYYCSKRHDFSVIDFDRLTFSRLVRFGGWITVSNIISPLLVYLDRFIVSNQVGANLVALYSTPAELIAKLTVVPQSLSRVIFQRLSQRFEVESNYTSLAQKLNFVLSAFLVLVLVIWAEELLVFWLGSAFAGESADVLRIMAIGFFFNSLAQIPFSVLQAKGKAALTAKIHLFEVLPYLAVMAYAVSKGGLVFAAIVWSFRMVFDYALMSYFSKKI